MANESANNGKLIIVVLYYILENIFTFINKIQTYRCKHWKEIW